MVALSLGLQIYLLIWIQTSQTGVHLYSDYKELEACCISYNKWFLVKRFNVGKRSIWLKLLSGHHQGFDV